MKKTLTKRTTKKAAEARYNTIMCVPYCELQFLLHYLSPVSYTANAYGWGADIYSINGAAIVTGYKPFGTIKPDADTLRKYDKAAESIIHDYNISYKAQTVELENLLDKFIAEVTE